jgi:hypothetical protein
LDLLTELGLTAAERRQVDRTGARLNADAEIGVAHLPLWMVLGEKPTQ